MKQVIAFFTCLIWAVPCLAQRDIKTLDKIGRAAIVDMVGQPDGKEYWGGVMEGYDAIQYPDTYICLDENTFELVGFNTTSPAFCMLSDYISGGFKVGDSLNRLKSFDFVHSKYGKNRSGNALELIDSNSKRDYYEAYGLERISFMFLVKDGKIIGISMAKRSEDSSRNCDMTNSPW